MASWHAAFCKRMRKETRSTMHALASRIQRALGMPGRDGTASVSPPTSLRLEHFGLTWIAAKESRMLIRTAGWLQSSPSYVQPRCRNPRLLIAEEACTLIGPLRLTWIRKNGACMQQDYASCVAFTDCTSTLYGHLIRVQFYARREPITTKAPDPCPFAAVRSPVPTRSQLSLH